ncbi:MAG TPA: hypothetical protein VMZ52_06065 [Bryobacteraceae bacterium]|nr:hypothetical protein [Bryobacteraceae bacterium]
MRPLTLPLALLLSLMAVGARSSHKSHGGLRTRLQRCEVCERDPRGRIARCAAARHEVPAGESLPSHRQDSGACPGYVIDHRHALRSGGTDRPENKQLQTREEAKAKDLVE